MLNQQIDYASLVEKALLRVVHDVLASVAEQGLPGRHHLYITFRTDHPGVGIDDTLYARYPNEMTIVLQHEYWGLEVADDRFAVTLSFNNAPQRLEVPFEAVTVFADPSVEFGLQFTRASGAGLEAEAPGEPAPQEAASESAPATPAAVATLPAAADRKPDRESPAETARDEADQGEEQAEGEGAEKIVTLDRFRKK